MNPESSAQLLVAAPPQTPDDGRLHVLYLNHSAQMSGGEASLRALLWQFRRSDAPIDPVLGLPGGGLFSELMRDEGFNVTLAPLRRIQRPRGLIDGMAALLGVLQTAPFITRLVNQSRSNLVHSNSTTAHLVGGLAAERAQKPAIWHVRDLVPLDKIAAQLAQRASRVIAISRCVAAQLEKDGVPKEKIVLIYNGLDPDEWRRRSRSRLRETLGWPDEAFVFGCVGQLVPWKNHAAFIEAAAKMAQDEGMENARFCIIGGDLWGEHQPYVSELRGLVKKYGLVERFNFIPHQSDAIDALSGLNCLVHPARDEPFGRVVKESMALRTPVIAMNENGPSEIITHEHDGILVEPGEDAAIIESLALQMARLFKDADLQQHLAQNARPSVEEKFHIANTANRTWDLYRDVAG